MKVTGDWLSDPRTQRVCAVLTGAGHRALFVGGCVRNALMGIPVADIDLSTDAHPPRVMDLAKRAGLRVVPTGIDHGTVTVVADGLPHEITTFRRDVETDGRRAVVAYTDRIEEDALRRDLTMNALYADPSGAVVDPLGGLPDLLARRVRFIEDPRARIREDYLRILRFFRFHALYGDPFGGLDADGLAACAELAPGLDTLSKERIGAELLKLLAAPDPAPATAAFAATGGLARVLPGADPTPLPVLVALELKMPADGLRRLALLGGADPAEYLRLSRREAKRLASIRAAALDASIGPGELGYRLGQRDGTDALLVRAALTAQPVPPEAQAEIARGAAATFPVHATDLQPHYRGRALGDKLRDLESAWITSGFTHTREDLLR